MQFTDLTDRARVPVTLVATQREQVDTFVRGAVTERFATGEFPPSATLFELLMPARLKEEFRNDRNVVLILDTTSARYPWELLCRSVNAEDKPLSVRAGMIRQLTEAYAPDRPVVAVGNKALVIGDPPTGLSEFPPLKGAREEAELVADQLERVFDVTKRIGCEDGSSSLAALLAGRWRILHLAGHGAVNFEKGGIRITGMALENGMFFTPENVGQMGAIPEFVFLNCCYLGLVDASAQKKAEARYHELAANVATAFTASAPARWSPQDGRSTTPPQSFSRKFFIANCSAVTCSDQPPTRPVSRFTKNMPSVTRGAPINAMAIPPSGYFPTPMACP